MSSWPSVTAGTGEEDTKLFSVSLIILESLSCLETGKETSSFVIMFVRGDLSALSNVPSGVFITIISSDCFATFASVNGKLTNTLF